MPGKKTAKVNIRKLVQPFQNFVQMESFSGILLLMLTVIALIWANMPFGNTYADLWHTAISIGLNGAVFSQSLHFWINDGLMTVFFLLVGLEIKRELLAGELSSPRLAALPIFAALGGMIFPALIYAAINHDTPASAGWGIPTATDIAFSLGVLTLLGSRVSVKLKVFLVALAIVDDMGAVVLIAIFYSTDLSVMWLAISIGIFLLQLMFNYLNVHRISLFIALGVLLWISLYYTGIHATIAGVLTAAAIPARTRIDRDGFIEMGGRYLDLFKNTRSSEKAQIATGKQQEIIMSIESVCEAAQAPLQRIEHKLHPWVTYLIMPLFALANAGVTVHGNILDSIAHGTTVGIMLGLMLGKPIGITLFTWLAVKMGFAKLPENESTAKIFGIGMIAGIGFTMSLFISNLAFGAGENLDISKIGILAGSFLSGILGYIYLYAANKNGIHKYQNK